MWGRVCKSRLTAPQDPLCSSEEVPESADSSAFLLPITARVRVRVRARVFAYRLTYRPDPQQAITFTVSPKSKQE